MKRFLPLLFLGSLFLFGCGSDTSASDEKKLRGALDQKTIDYSQVDPANRAIVLAQMRAHGGAKKADELEKQWGMKK